MDTYNLHTKDVSGKRFVTNLHLKQKNTIK
jgi:hypothetical protein